MIRLLGNRILVEKVAQYQSPTIQVQSATTANNSATSGRVLQSNVAEITVGQLVHFNRLGGHKIRAAQGTGADVLILHRADVVAYE